MSLLPLGQCDHRDLMHRVRKLGRYGDPFDGIEVPNDRDTCGALATAWNKCGEQAEDTGERVRKALDTLTDGGSGGWQGPAATEFRKKAEEVIKYAHDLAHMCDKSFPAGKPPEPDPASKSNFAREAPDDGKDGFKQQFERLATEIKGVYDKLDERVPMPPWWKRGEQWALTWGVDQERLGWLYSASGVAMGAAGMLTLPISGPLGVAAVAGSVHNSAGGTGLRERGLQYDIVKRAGGKETEIKGDISCLDMEKNFKAWNIPVKNETWGVQGFYQLEAWVPADANKGQQDVFFQFHLNKGEEETCKKTAGELAKLYKEIAEKLPTPPEAPKGVGDAGAGGAAGGGAGTGPGGGPGGAPGGGAPPSLRDRPAFPQRPEPPRFETTPHPPEKGIWKPDPGDPGGPGDPDRRRYTTPGFPDPRRGPFDPRDPGGPGVGIDPGDIDTGSEGARVGDPGAGGPGTGPGSGGPGSGGPGSGGPGAGVGTGAGAGPAGGPGAAGSALGGAGTRGLGGGMMPMGGMGGGAGAGEGQENDRGTWLEEDEDVWGADSDAPPPVLGGSAF